MSSSSKQEEVEAMMMAPQFEAFRRVKRLRLFEPSLSVLVFVVVTAFVVCCFFYLYNRDFATRFGLMDQPRSQKRFTWLRVKGSFNEEEHRVEFLGEKGDGCDLFDGKWVYITLKIAAFWIKDFGVWRMEEVICFTPSGDGNPNIVTYPVPSKDLIYEVNGSPITKHKGFLAFKFRDFNCTVEYYRSPFQIRLGQL